MKKSGYSHGENKKELCWTLGLFIASISIFYGSLGLLKFALPLAEDFAKSIQLLLAFPLSAIIVMLISSFISACFFLLNLFAGFLLLIQELWSALR